MGDPWGASKARPKKSRNELFLTTCCCIAFVSWYIYGSHAKNQPETSKFEQDFRISKFCKIDISHHLDKRKIDITRLILKIQDSNFTCKPNFYSRKNHILASRSKDHFLRQKYDIFKKKILWVPLFRGPVGG